MTKIKRCGECGSKDVALKSVKGKTFPYKAFNKLKLKIDLDLNVCNACGNIMITSGDSALLDKALEATIAQDTQYYINNIIQKNSWLQSEMAHYVGITPVYISEVKNGKKIPEFKTFNYLKILSECAGAIELIVEDDPSYIKNHFKYKFGAAIPVNNLSDVTVNEAAESNEYDYAFAA